MRNNRTKAAAVAALVTAGAIAVGGATGGAFATTQARRSNGTVPPWCGVICMRASTSSANANEQLALRGRKAGKPQDEYLLAIPGIRGTGGGAGGQR